MEHAFGHLGYHLVVSGHDKAKNTCNKHAPSTCSPLAHRRLEISQFSSPEGMSQSPAKTVYLRVALGHMLTSASLPNFVECNEQEQVGRACLSSLLLGFCCRQCRQALMDY